MATEYKSLGVELVLGKKSLVEISDGVLHASMVGSDDEFCAEIQLFGDVQQENGVDIKTIPMGKLMLSKRALNFLHNKGKIRTISANQFRKSIK